MIPDGTVLRRNGEVWKVFAPAWWRIDRWFVWFVVLALRVPRAKISVSYMHKEGATSRLRMAWIRVYREERWRGAR